MFASFNAFSAELDAAAGGEAGPLHVGIFADFAGGCKLGGTRAVRVAAGHVGTPLATWTTFHKC